MRCDSCNKQLIKVDRRTELAELEEDATDGQMADYFATELSGDYGAWGIGIVEYYCPSCDRVFQFITDELKSYDPLIVSWLRIPAIAATHSAVKAATQSGHCCHPIGAKRRGVGFECGFRCFRSPSVSSVSAWNHLSVPGGSCGAPSDLG